MNLKVIHYKKKIDVIILYEKAVRELDVCCLLKVLLEIKGFTAEIIHIVSDCSEALLKFTPSIVILPYCYNQESNNIYLMQWQKSIFVNLNWEQFFYRGNIKAKSPKGKFALNYIKHFVWSNDFKNFLIQQGVKSENIFVNGNSYLGLYDKKYKKNFKSRVELETEFKIKRKDLLIFFPENYNWAFYPQKMLNQMIKNGQPKEQVYKMKDYISKSFELSMIWCKKILQEFKNVQIVLRPRPSTSEEEMRKKILEIIGEIPSRLIITRSHTTIDWTISANIVISSYSTTLIEAAILKKNIYILSPIKPIKDLEQVWNKHVTKIYTYTSLKNIFLKKAFKNPNFQKLNLWAFNNLLKDGDPIEILADQLKNFILIKNKKILYPSKESILYDKPRFINSKIWWNIKLLRSYLSVYKNFYFPSKKFNEEEIVDISAKDKIKSKCKNFRKILFT